MAINPEVSAMLQQGIEAAKRGDRATAANLLQQVVEADERNEQAWLWLSGVVESQEDMQVCLENVLEINPNNARAAAGLRWLQQQATSTPPPSQDGSGGTALSSGGGGDNDTAASQPPPIAATDTFFPPPTVPSPDQTASASSFGQPAASPFAQQPPTSPFAASLPFGSPPPPPPDDGPQYLPFGQAAPPPRPVAAPAPPPLPAPPASEPEEVNPFSNRRPPSGALASRLNATTTTDSSDLSALRSSLFGGAPASGSNDERRADSDPQPSASPFAAPPAGSAYPDAAPSPFAARPATNPFAALAAAPGDNPFTPTPVDSGNLFAAPPSDANPYGISSDLQPFSLQDAHEQPNNSMQNGNGSANYSLQTPSMNGDSPSANPFAPPSEAHPPLFAPRPALGDALSRPAGLAGRAGLGDLMNRTPPPLTTPDSEVVRPSSPMLIARPPLPGGRAAVSADVATFPCPNCRKLVAENSLSCPSCAFQFYARCPNCSEYVDTTVPSSPRGDHCTNCGIIINLMELGRAGSATSAVTVSSGSIRPRSTAAMGEGMTLMSAVPGLTVPAGKPRRSRGRLIYQLFVLLFIIGLIVFAYWYSHNNPPKSSSGTPTGGQVIPATVISGITTDEHAINVARIRLGAAVSHLGSASSLTAIVAAQQQLSTATSSLAAHLDLAASLSYASLPAAPSWYAQNPAQERTWIALNRTNLTAYQQALNKSAPLWTFLGRYYAWMRDSSSNLSSLGAPQAVSNSADPAQRDAWLARQRDETSLSAAARQAAADASCPALDQLAAELDNLAQLDGLHAAVIADLLDLDTSAAQQDTAAAQTLAAEIKTQAFYHPSLLDTATFSTTLQRWYASNIAGIYNRSDEMAAQQFAGPFADDQFAPAADRPNPSSAPTLPGDN